MKENKTNLILIAAVTGFIVFLLAGAVIFSDSSKKTPELSSTFSDTESHHQSVPPDESRFNSLFGKKAPNFILESFEGKTIELEKLRGKKVVLFFTEGLMCYPACWNQMAAFGDDDAFNNKDVITLNIAVDRKNDWNEAVSKMPELAKTTVLFDTDRSVSQEYGALTLPSSMHKGQFPGHTYIIVDRNGVITFTYDDPLMAIRNDELKKELEKIK